MISPIERYLAKRADLRRPLVAPAGGQCDQVVVIPVHAEEEHLYPTLLSLRANDPEEVARTLVICVVNNPQAPNAAYDENQRTLRRLREHPMSDPLRLGYIDASSAGCELEGRGGVGAARRLGMDWALEVLRRSTSTRERMLLSLDADSPVNAGYLTALRAWGQQREAWAAVAHYEHELPSEPRQRAAMIDYELFLRYHVLGLRFARSPFAFPAVGSIIACIPKAYAAVSGMNRRQGAEDFYFLQELAKTGPVAPVPSAIVYPSARLSARVPFGTGTRVATLMREAATIRVYDPNVYRVVHDWLAHIEAELDGTGDAHTKAAAAISPALTAFLQSRNFPEQWDKIRRQARSRRQLTHQFHRWFDAFVTLKLIHHLRETTWADVDIGAAFPGLRALGEQTLRRIAETTFLSDQREHLLRALREEAKGACPCGLQ